MTAWTACTEQQASEKWCPHIRMAIVMTDGSLSLGNVALGTRPECIGSRCMQWRWFEDDPGQYAQGISRRGYCGLAGLP